MEDFYILNPNSLLNQTDELSQINSNITSVKEQISNYCNMISNYWQSDTSDKESYIGSLKKTLQDIDDLNNVIVSLSYKLRYFAEQSISESSR